MESPPLKLNVARDEDRISALPDELLLRILERLDLPEAVRAAAVSTRWRHLPHQLSLVIFQIHHFRGATLVETMDAIVGALLSVCPPAERNCECQRGRAIKTIGLCFYLSAPHLSSIGSAVEDVVSRGKTKRIEFRISPPPADNTALQLTEFGQQFMSFFRAIPIGSILSRIRHSCAKTPEYSAEKTNVVWGPSKDFKHFNLKRLGIQGFEEEDKATNYIRLVMERAVGLKRIVLHRELPCESCHDFERISQVDEARRRRVKERLTQGSSSSVEIIIRQIR